jgi:hypothetical protein
MPLVHVAAVLEERRNGRRLRRRASRPKSFDEKIHVVVYSQGNRNIGLHVERILDVVEEHIDLQEAGVRPGVLGTAVIKDIVTELLDVESFVKLMKCDDAPQMARAA